MNCYVEYRLQGLLKTKKIQAFAFSTFYNTEYRLQGLLKTKKYSEFASSTLYNEKVKASNGMGAVFKIKLLSTLKSHR